MESIRVAFVDYLNDTSGYRAERMYAGVEAVAGAVHRYGDHLFGMSGALGIIDLFGVPDVVLDTVDEAGLPTYDDGAGDPLVKGVEAHLEFLVLLVVDDPVHLLVEAVDD